MLGWTIRTMSSSFISKPQVMIGMRKHIHQRQKLELLMRMFIVTSGMDNGYSCRCSFIVLTLLDRMNQCAMDRDRLPSDVSLQCANNIIFIGKAMQTFYQSKHAKSKLLNAVFYMVECPLLKLFLPLDPTFKDQLQTEKHAKALVELSHSKVKHDQMQFEYIIGNMKNVVSKALMNIVGEDCSLLADLQVGSFLTSIDLSVLIAD